jgi:peptidoglycan hydrolase CwlO-like protein
MELAVALSILASVISVANFVLNRKDKSNQTTKDDSYKWGKIDEKLASIEKTLAKIESKMDSFDTEIEEKIKVEIEHHVKEYHGGAK